MTCLQYNRIVEHTATRIVLLYVLISPPTALCSFFIIVLFMVGGGLPSHLVDPLVGRLENLPPTRILLWVAGGYFASHALALILGAIMALLFDRVREAITFSLISVIAAIYVPSFVLVAIGLMPPYPLGGSIQMIIAGCGATAGIVCALICERIRSGDLAR